jgi:hypothetical protein
LPFELALRCSADEMLVYEGDLIGKTRAERRSLHSRRRPRLAPVTAQSGDDPRVPEFGDW